MDEEPEVLLLTDSKAFMAVVQNHDAEERVQSLHTLDDIMTCEALRHGIFNDQEALPGLVQFYNQIFLQAPVERRRQIYGYVAMIVPQLGGWIAGAITPFMLLDPNPGIVSTATIDYTSLGSLFENDPMTRPKDVVTMIEKDIPQNPAAVIGGLIALGDPRVCDLVAPVRRNLDSDQAAVVTRCFTGTTAKCVVAFYLDWLDELVDRRDYEGQGIFGNVAAGLHRLASERTVPFIRDGQRPFPVPGGKNPKWPDAYSIDAREFANSIADRLFDLERREGPPKVLPHAIRAFGLTPKTSSEDIAAPM